MEGRAVTEGQKVFVAPGNAGTAREPKCENIAVQAEDVDGLLKFAQTNKIDLTLVGPETPLVLGVVDRFKAAGLRCFGPTKAAAQLEGSKAFTKDFLARHKIPTAAYGNFTDVGPPPRRSLKRWGRRSWSRPMALPPARA